MEVKMNIKFEENMESLNKLKNFITNELKDEDLQYYFILNNFNEIGRFLESELQFLESLLELSDELKSAFLEQDLTKYIEINDKMSKIIYFRKEYLNLIDEIHMMISKHMNRFSKDIQGLNYRNLLIIKNEISEQKENIESLNSASEEL
jgi:hypothetical protein